MAMREIILTQLLLLSALSMQAQTAKQTETTPAPRSRVAEQNKARLRELAPRYPKGSVQALLASEPSGPVQIYLTCGIYTENIVVASSDVRILGAERGCVQIQPADPTLPAITIDATNTGTSGMHFDEVSDLTMICPTGETCADGLKIMGRLDINQPNDFHKFSRIGVYGSFQNGIDLAGRTIWTEFDNLEVSYALGNGINIASSAVANSLTFRNIRSAENYGYGVYINNTQVDHAQGILFDTSSVEYNGLNTGMTNCAGLYMTGVVQANIENSYFEGNCQGNTADKLAAEIRISGTYANSVNIIDTSFNLQYGEGGIYNDAVLTTGTYQGNKFDTSTDNFTIYVATSHPASNVVLGENFNTSPIIIPDGNGMTHVRMLSPFAFDYQPVASVSGNSVPVSSANGLILYYGPYTINNFTGGYTGQILYVTALNVNGHVLTNSAGGAGQIVFPDGMNRTLNIGESLLLYYDGTNWRPIESSVTSQPRYVGTITTSGGSVDTISVQGLTSAAHCQFSARNPLAAGQWGVYITPGEGSVSLIHSDGSSVEARPATPIGSTPTPVGLLSGAVYDVFCSAN
jgi:hypothetical protein